MNAAELLAMLTERGARVQVVGDRLRIEAPAGVLTPELKAAMVAEKAALLALLTSGTAGGTPAARQLAAPPPPAAPCPCCRGRRWWLRHDGVWVCDVCHPAPLPDEAVRALAPLHTLRDALTRAARELAEALDWPAVPLDRGRSVAAGRGPWHAFLAHADMPALRLAVERLRAQLEALAPAAAQEAGREGQDG